ncbi:MAG: cytochrome bc complex cytochrome b subunit [Deltaproteobacteria bacterium]|jgi:ubiquinol-cytochrome c reductase cytochrome b subunit|nr:cytochrome bc complex cytochrome b subunit [Deltaproteobacteria bacterium]
MKIVKILVDFIDVRLGVREIFNKELAGYLLPRNVNIWYTLGAVLIALFGLQILTGTLLLAFYVPDAEKAYASVQYIMNDVPYGWLMRMLHAVGANVIVIALLLHMLSVLYMGSYKGRREFTWLSGFTIFNLALGLCLTGYLLPWSQLSFWATTVATDAPGAIPIIGDSVVEFLRGGPTVDNKTLGRFFALHVVGMPLILLGLIGFHLFCVKRRGISNPPFGPDYKSPELLPMFEHEVHPGGIPFFPNYMVKDAAVICFFLALQLAIIFYAPNLFFPESAFEPADPFVTPPGIKPEWYFLWAYQTLKIFPSEIIGLGVQGAFMTFLALLPFIDRGPERRPGKRPLFLTCYALGILLFVAISIWGHYS